ncbi:DUF2076 domain-containing protein [Ensifer soli]|uniref:DUF2076 domain-containing protein n=1 Tax=Ciceribacter sp. sgz301302 TaxID=3342379 RepID=UPI0035BACEB7
MDSNDRQAIEGLFSKLSEVERQSGGGRDTAAEGFIKERIAGQPSAPYYMAQTIVVQEQALNAAQQRIEELEYEAANRSQSSGGGLLSSLFGGSRQPAPPRPVPGTRPPVGAASPWGQQPAAQQGFQRSGGGGGFLAGAAQTAMGVAGGVLLGNAIAGMFSGDEANAAETGATEAPAAEDAGGGMDDMGDMDF